MKACLASYEVICTRNCSKRASPDKCTVAAGALAQPGSSTWRLCILSLPSQWVVWRLLCRPSRLLSTLRMSGGCLTLAQHFATGNGPHRISPLARDRQLHCWIQDANHQGYVTVCSRHTTLQNCLRQNGASHSGKDQQSVTWLGITQPLMPYWLACCKPWLLLPAYASLFYITLSEAGGN